MLVMLLQYGFYVPAGILLGIAHGGLTLFFLHYFRFHRTCQDHVKDLSFVDGWVNTIGIALCGFVFRDVNYVELWATYIFATFITLWTYSLTVDVMKSCNALLQCARSRRAYW